MGVESVGTPGLWAAFVAFVLAMLALDLGVFHRKAHEVSMREALGWSIVWVGLAGVFGVAVHWMFGPTAAIEFAAGYLVEKALAVDNIFVFVVLFSAFAVPSRLQHRVLFWGVLGALALRAGFILVGAALLDTFHWLIYVFGAILVVTAVRLLTAEDKPADPKDSWLMRTLARWVPMTSGYRDDAFIVREGARWLVTPLFAVLVLVEATDLLFAVDSIPAIFAITRDPFIVFTSNVFAILGLRSLYFLLADVVTRFHYLKPGLAFILAFVGVKLLVSGVVHLPVALSLAVVAATLTLAVLASWAWPPRGRGAAG